MKYSKITVSGRICTGKSTLFLKLEKKLNWPTFHTGQIFREYVKKHGLTLEAGKEQDVIARKIDMEVKEKLEAPGHLLVDSWMAGIMADDLPGVLRILLTCDDKVRAQRFAQRENLPVDESLKKILERENNVLNKLKEMYKKNGIFDPKYYNLVINTTNLTENEVFEKVLNKLYE